MNWHHFEKIESYLPVQLWGLSEFLMAMTVILIFILIRYFSLVYLAYYFFWTKKNLPSSALHDQNIKSGQIAYEIKWSLISSIIFAFSGYLIGLLWQNGYTKIYLSYSEYGFWYLPLSLIIYSLVHEVYFYFTHVLMHVPSIYTRIHSVHHFSRKTSPWASFSFHPGEAIIQAAFIPLIVCLIPIHPTMLITYLLIMTVTAISNHLGTELISSKKLNRWFISGTHHSTHHEKYNFNFGLYYCFMDQLFKTDRKPEAL